MQLVGQGDIVDRALFVFLSIMLFASLYLFLIKAINLFWQAYHGRKFLNRLAKARSLQQVQELVDRQATIESFSRLSHHIMVEKRKFDRTHAKYGQQENALGAIAQRSIAHETAEQTQDLHQGLNVLAAIVWAAPLTGLVATGWRAVWLWLQPTQAGRAHSDLYRRGVVAGGSRDYELPGGLW